VLLRFWLTLTQGGAVNRYALGIGLGTILLVLVLRRLARRYRLPQVDMLVTLIVAALVAAHFGWSIPGADGKTLLSVVGNVPASLPRPHIPQFKFWWVKEMSSSALAIAFLGLLEALAIAKSIANDTRQRLDYNRQCLAEGLANLAGGFFQSLPGSGSLTRSAINHQAGAVSRMSGVFASAVVALGVLALAPFAQFIPKAALAGLLMVTAARLVDWKRIRYALRASRYDAGLLLVTCFSSIFISVEFSILIGVAVSILLFVPRAARLRGSELVVTGERVVRERVPEDPPCSAVIIWDLEGEVFFGSGPELDRCFDGLKQRAGNADIGFVVLRLKRTRNPDLVFLERLEHFCREMQRHGRTVLLCGVRPELAEAMNRLHFQDWLPAGTVFLEEEVLYSSTIKAVRRAYKLMRENSCAHCRRTETAGETEDALYYLV
jgi:SulP family sulfate permease